MTIRYLDEPPAVAELVIVGGGVVGAATAFHARPRRDCVPLIVEARPRLCTLTTPVAAGAFRLQFDDLRGAGAGARVGRARSCISRR